MAKKANEIVRNMLAQRGGKANVGAVLDALWDQFDGAEGIASEAKVQYDAAKDGSSAKLNMLSTLIEQMGKMEAQKSKAGQDEIDLPENEAAAVFNHLMEQMRNGTDLPPELRESAIPGGDQPSSPARGSGDDSEKYQG